MPPALPKGRHRDHRNFVAHAKGHQAVAGIGDQWHARVAHESNFGALLQLDQQFRRARHLVVFVIADQRFRDAVVVQELLRVAGIFAGDQVDFS